MLAERQPQLTRQILQRGKAVFLIQRVVPISAMGEGRTANAVSRNGRLPQCRALKNELASAFAEIGPTPCTEQGYQHNLNKIP